MGNWGGIPGQGRLKKYFDRALRRSQISHAYILEGEPGTPGRQMAEALARMLECENGTGCGSCSACRMFDAGSHPDVIRVVHEKTKTIGVGEIREQLVSNMRIMPYRGPYKIYLVDEADKMTTEAQNALLQTLEEPPVYGVMILIAENAQRLLPTIQSRSICLRLENPGRGENLLPEEQRRSVLSFLKGETDPERRTPADFVSEWKKGEILYPYLFHLFRLWFRDVLVWKEMRDERSLALKDEAEAIRVEAERFTYREIGEILEEIDRTERRIARNVNSDLALELLLSEIQLRRGPEAREEDR